MKKRYWFILIGILTVSAVLGSWLPFRMTIDIDNSFISIKNSIARAAEPEVGEIIDARTATTKTYYLGSGNYSMEACINAIHYKEGAAWLDIDTNYYDYEAGEYTARFSKIPYIVRMGDDSGRRIYPDRNDLSYWIDLYKPFQNMGTPSKQGGYWYWDFPHAIIAVRVCNTSVKFAFRMKDNQCPDSITIPFDTEGITRQGSLLYHDGEVVAQLQKPTAIDDNGIERDCDVVFDVGEITISLDNSGLAYPIDIDPTVDVQIDAGANDGYWDENNNFNNNNNYTTIGKNSGGAFINSFFRWENITVSGTVGVAYIELYSNYQNGTPAMKIYGVDEDNPDAPTTAAEANADDTTSHSVDWDGAFNDEDWNESPSIVDIIQEMVDTYTIENDALMIYVEDDGSSNGHINQVRTYELSGNVNGAKLYIEYTPGGATPDIYTTPTSKAFGVVAASSTFYSNGSTPSWPLGAGDCYFTVTNNGTMTIDIAANATNWTGGVGWTLTNDSPGENTVRMSLYAVGDNATDNLTLGTGEAAAWVSSLAASDNIGWEIKLETGTFTDGEGKTTHVYLIASAS